MQKLRFSALLLCFIILACVQNTKKIRSGQSSLDKSEALDASLEVEKWKNELLSGKQIGAACNYDSLGSLNAQEWQKNNLEQADGLRLDDKEIKLLRSDFDGDGANDLLLYFSGENCTGHNGGTISYAKLVYSDGTVDSKVMEEIISAIQLEYNKMRQAGGNLKEVTDNYLETTTIDSYDKGIEGRFRLYTKHDAHCCPSYSGSYHFLIQFRSIKIEVSESV